MTNDVALDVATYLQAAGVGTLGAVVFAGQMPEATDTALCVTTYAGQPADKIVPIEFPRVQVRTRAKDKRIAYDLCTAAKVALHATTDATINGVLYKRIDATGAPEFIGKDEVQRFNFTVNFQIVKVVG